LLRGCDLKILVTTAKHRCVNDCLVMNSGVLVSSYATLLNAIRGEGMLPPTQAQALGELHASWIPGLEYSPIDPSIATMDCGCVVVNYWRYLMTYAFYSQLQPGAFNTVIVHESSITPKPCW
jgi:hypothetical protein